MAVDSVAEWEAENTVQISYTDSRIKLRFEVFIGLGCG